MQYFDETTILRARNAIKRVNRVCKNKKCIVWGLVGGAVAIFAIAVWLFSSFVKPVPDDGANATMTHISNLRGVRYCEIFLIGGNGLTHNLHGAVYNTSELNNAQNPLDTCPASM
jgi:hypothetical protein